MSVILLGDTKEVIIRIDERLKHVEKDVEKLQIDVTEVKKDVKSLESRLNRVEDKVDMLWDKSFSGNINNPNILLPAYSQKIAISKGVMVLAHIMQNTQYSEFS